MKKLFIFLACVMLPVLSYAQEQNAYGNDNQQVVENEVPKMHSASDWDCPMPPMTERMDSVSWYHYREVAYPSSIAAEVAGMCERGTPMGIFIMLLGSFALLAIGIVIVTVLVKLVIMLFPNKRKKEE